MIARPPGPFVLDVSDFEIQPGLPQQFPLVRRRRPGRFSPNDQPEHRCAEHGPQQEKQDQGDDASRVIVEWHDCCLSLMLVLAAPSVYRKKKIGLPRKNGWELKQKTRGESSPFVALRPCGQAVFKFP